MSNPEKPTNPADYTGPRHVVRTCHTVRDDLEGDVPAIPAGTYGIALTDEGHFDYGTVDFGAPWGVQRIGNHCLLDAGAVLGKARGAIVMKRPWRAVMRRVLRSMGGPYVMAAAQKHAFNDDTDECSAVGSRSFAVEALLYRKGSRKFALKLLDEAMALAEPKRAKP